MSDTVQLSDQFLLASSLKTEPDVHVSKGKPVIFVTDLQQGYSSGQVTIDATNQINGSEGFASLREAYLTVPYVITARAGATNLAALPNRFACTLKTGVWNIISDLELELNGKSILTTNDYKSFWNNLRAMTETSISDMYKHGAETFLQPDDWYSINFSNTTSQCGDGYANNQLGSLSDYLIDGTLSQSQENRAFNTALLSRLAAAPPVVDETTNNAWGWASLGKDAIANIVAQNGKSCYLEPNIVGGASSSANTNVGT